jgi:Domain of unknown function (DUF4296)
MKTGLLIIFCSLIITGCKNKSSIPAAIIPQKKMQAIVWDMMRADLFLSDFALRKDSTLDKRKESIKLYQQVFDIHHTSKEQFQQSFAFYKSHLSLFKAMMDSLSQPTTEAPTQIVKPQIIQDTFQPANKAVPFTDTVKPFRRIRRLPVN